MRHFETKKEALKYRDSKAPNERIYKKMKGHKNRFKKPFVVCSFIEWINLY